MRARRRKLTALVAFALLGLAGELVGRSLTIRVDRALHVQPAGIQDARYYPFLLAGAKIVTALAAAALAWRIVRALGTLAAGDRLLATIGHRRRSSPRLRLRISPQRWLASFAATSLWFLAQNDYERLAQGRWPLLAPWLHTYALPVFAVLAILLALGWGAVRDWLAEVDDYAAAALAFVRGIIHTPSLTPVRPPRPADDRNPRRFFGLAFESRPPPLPA